MAPMRFVRPLIREIHRRSLWQVVGIYLAGSWIGYQVVLGLTAGLALPDWVPPLAIILFLVGLPIVVATAFVNEGGPARRTTDATLFPELEPLDGMPPAARPPHVRLLSWRRVLTAGVAAFAVLGLSAGGYSAARVAGIGPMGSLIAKGTLAADDALLLADFAGPPADSLLTSALTEALRVDLGQSRTVTLVQPVAVRRALERMVRDPAERLDEGLAREVARRENIRAVLAGEVGRLAGSWVLTMRLVAAEDGAELAAFRETARDSTELIPAVDRLSRKVRARIGESLREVRASEPLEAVTTSSLEALRRYTQALRLFDTRRDPERAYRLLEEAVAIDTTFAMAWRRLAAELSNDWGDPARLEEAATRAYRLADRLPEQERLHAIMTYQLHVLNDGAAATATGELLIERFPDDRIAHNNTALAYGRRGAHDRAIALYRTAVRLDTLVAIYQSNLAFSLMSLGRYDEAAAELAVYRRRFPEGGGASFEAVLTASRGDHGAAYPQMQGAVDELPMGPQKVRGIAWATALALVNGRVAEGYALADQLERIFLANYTPHEVLGVAGHRARFANRVLRQPDAAAALLDRALEQHPLDEQSPLNRPYLFLASLYAEAGRVDRARALLAAFDAEMPATRRAALSAGRAAVLGEIALAEGRGLDAVQQFRLAETEADCERCMAMPLSDAFLAAGQPDSALVHARRFVDTPAAFNFMLDYWDLARALERLGELHEERGERKQALEAWARLTRLWKDADPVLQPRVRRAQDRVRALMANPAG
jgi:eukaryotic-like serine/threonine-protein kinase